MPGRAAEDMYADVLAAEESGVRESLERILACGNLRWRLLAPVGDPADVLWSVANEVGADLIVTGRHGGSLLRGLLQGSVSNRIVHHSDRPVLVVP